MDPTIVYSERTNEELEELFRTIINDEEFYHACDEKLKQYEETHPFDYDQISSHSHDPSQPQVVHEITMSIHYNIEVDKNDSDLTYVQ